MKKSLSSITALLFLALSLNAQVERSDNAPKADIWSAPWDAKEVSFEDIEKNFKAYWKDREIQKGKGYKPYMRWKTYVEPRIYPSGDLTLPSTTYQNYVEWQKKQPAATRSAPSSWSELGPFAKPSGADSGVGRLNMVRFDPNNTDIMYVGAADGGLWKSTNAGGSWTTNTDFLTVIGVSDLAIDPGNTQIMYLATGDIEGDRRSIGVLKSIDGGGTWDPTGLMWEATDDYKISKLLMDPSNSSILLAATDGGVFRTTNGGATWTAPDDTAMPIISPVVNFKDMKFKPGDSNTVYAAGTTFWKSTNNGINWTQITSGLPAASSVARMTIGVSIANPAYVYVVAGKSTIIPTDPSNNGYLGTYKSTNSGSSFGIVTPTQSPAPNILGYVTNGMDMGGQANYDLTVTVAPDDANLVTVGGVNIWQSTDGGASWSLSSHWDPTELAPGYEFVHADIHELSYLPGSNTTMFACNDGGISKFINSTDGWFDISNNLRISQQNTIGVSGSTEATLVSGLQDIGSISTTGAWQVVGGGDGEDCFIDRTNDNNIVISGINGSHELSKNGLAGPFNDITSGLPTGTFFSPIRQHPVTANTYYAAGRPNLYRSTNQGTSWSSTGDAPFLGDNIVEFMVSPSTPTIIYALKETAIAKSINSGSTWTDITGSLPTGTAALSNLTISNVDDKKVWVTFSGYADGTKVYQTSDGGTTWSNLSAGLPNIPVNTIVFENGSANEDLYVGMDIGVYHKDNTPGLAASWTAFSINLPNVRVKDLRIFYGTPKKLRAATYGRGSWESNLFTTLPVELISFTGKNQSGINVLDWNTASEENLDRYVVQRSPDGVRFENIGTVYPTSANSTIEMNYGFKDVQPAKGINYYRLKIEDLDGQFEYSKIIVLYLDDQKDVIRLYPNPTSNHFTLGNLEPQEVMIRLLDGLGRTLWFEQINSQDQIDVSNFSNGIYFIEIQTTNGRKFTERFIKE